jgi:hypothetical protein
MHLSTYGKVMYIYFVGNHIDKAPSIVGTRNSTI